MLTSFSSFWTDSTIWEQTFLLHAQNFKETKKYLALAKEYSDISNLSDGAFPVLFLFVLPRGDQ